MTTSWAASHTRLRSCVPRKFFRSLFHHEDSGQRKLPWGCGRRPAISGARRGLGEDGIPWAPDDEVLERATSESRILITFDKDFGALAFRSGLAAPSGIVLFRIPATSPSHVARTSVAVLESRADWAGHFSVVEPGGLRMRPLPRMSRGPEPIALPRKINLEGD